jgi:hypothetical protein
VKALNKVSFQKHIPKFIWRLGKAFGDLPLKHANPSCSFLAILGYALSSAKQRTDFCFAENSKKQKNQNKKNIKSKPKRG